MRVIITGGTGLIGRALIVALREHDHEIIVLSRDPGAAAASVPWRGSAKISIAGWDGKTAGAWGKLITPECAIVNLAGATPMHWRWTPAYKAHILQSRLWAGQALIQAIARFGPPAVLAQASASGYYGDSGQARLTEANTPGRGFRAEVCQAWERSTANIATRRCILRTGIVLDTHRGALPSLLRFASLCGRQLGDGVQWIPWIHRRDAGRAIRFLLEEPALSGPFNLCAPEPATNCDFLRAVRGILQRPGLFPAPAWALRAALGEMSTVVLDSQRLVPQRLLAAGFTCDFAQLEQALSDLLCG